MLLSQTIQTPANSQHEPDAQLYALYVLHDDLDAVISALLQAGLGDDLLLGRLKKRKLRLKDEITALQAKDASTDVARAS